jgi:ubiquinone/menaquinone biosynthesis C-methylase UbiE
MPPIARYDEIADFYAGEIGDHLDDPGTAGLLELLGPVTGLRLLDLACGQGRMTRELARRGAAVSGADLSVPLVTQARDMEREVPLGIDYVIADAGDAAALGAGSFDGVVCNFGLSDIDDLDGTLSTVSRVLRHGGFFVMSILHPCFPGWTENVSGSWPAGRGYFAEGWWRANAASSRIRQQVGANHRMMSTYLNSLARHGLVVQAALEPLPPQSWLTDNPAADPVPTFLVLRCVNIPSQAEWSPRAASEAESG